MTFLPDPLDDAAEKAAVVTVTLDNGRIYTGTVHEHRTEPNTFVLRTGSRGRPPVFHRADVVEVLFE